MNRTRPDSSATRHASSGSQAQLEDLYLAEHRPTGPIPSELGGQTELKRVHLQNNELTSTIPAALGNLGSQAGKLLDVKIANGNAL